MASTYVNNLRLNEMGTGDASGTWGNTTNTNLELIGEALAFGTEGITTNANTHATVVADGSTDAGRAMVLKYTGTLDSACTITISPNTIKRAQYIHNGTSGSQNIIISQGSGANVTIPAGYTKLVHLDGAGSGAAVVDALVSGLNMGGLSYPIADGSNGQFMTTNGSGVLSFGTVDLSTKANINSQTFTGTPSAPTANAGTNTTQLATTAFVKTAVDNAEPFPQGTSMLFQQTSAPTGWTKQTTHNDKAIRLTSGTVGTGGSVAFTTAFATPAVSVGSVTGNPGTNLAAGAGNLAVSMSGNISNTTLSVNQIPSHSHVVALRTSNGNIINPNFAEKQNVYGNMNTSNTGGSGAHNHGHNLSGTMNGAPSLSGNVTAGNLAVASSTATINVQYVDFIIANKD